MARRVRDRDHRHLDAPAFLQRRGRLPWRARLLAADRVLPHRDVHCAGEGPEVEHEMGVPTTAELRVPYHLCRLSRRLHRRSTKRSQGLQAIQVTSHGPHRICWIVMIYHCCCCFCCSVCVVI